MRSSFNVLAVVLSRLFYSVFFIVNDYNNPGPNPFTLRVYDRTNSEAKSVSVDTKFFVNLIKTIRKRQTC